MHVRRKKQNRYIMLLSGMLTGMFCIMALPLLSGREGVAEAITYEIVIGEQGYGSYDTMEEAAREVTKVRRKLDEKSGGQVLTSVTCSVEPALEHKKSADADKNVTKQLIQALEEYTEQQTVEAYTIQVSECTVTVRTEEDVILALEAIKNNYDTNNSYGISLMSKSGTEYLVPAFYVREGADTAGLQGIGFEQELEIAAGYVSQEEIVDYVTAAAILTKQWETPTKYVVEKGDCLSLIAEKHGMNTAQLMELNQLTDSEYINIGDELVVTVVQPEVSVWYKIRAAYEEQYEAQVEYRDNDSWYEGTEKVLQEGSTGVRQVVADICYSNGAETGREIVEETLLAEAVPRIVERGTATPPSFIKPLVGGSFSSPFGSRWGRMHKGVDWSCSIGTAIRASCGGRVASAGWVNGYGYCITISHSDGKQTRYAHLSKILVSSGQRVQQGDKIALSGNTGNSTGPHLHFEILVNGVQVNPLNYLN